MRKVMFFCFSVECGKLKGIIDVLEQWFITGGDNVNIFETDFRVREGLSVFYYFRRLVIYG